MRKPFEMTVEDFDEFRRIELEWLIENGIIEQYESEAIFRNVIHGTTPIKKSRVIKIIKITDDSYSIIVEDDWGRQIEYSVVGNIDYINKKLGISSGHE